jgi:hypothetical protein
MKKTFLFSAVFIFALPGAFAQKQTEGRLGKSFLDVVYSCAAANDGGYILTGLTHNGINDAYGDIMVIKTLSSGDTSWTFTCGGPKLEGGNCVIQTADGGYMVSGHTEDFGARDCDAFLMKLDKNGRQQWLKVYGGDEDDICEGTIEMPNGDFVFAGITASWGVVGRRHVYFVRTNSSGDTVWTKNYGGTGTEYGYSITGMAKGGFLAAGFSNSWGSGEEDGWLLRLNDNGDTLWTRLYKNGGNTRFYKILPALDNGFMLAGFTTQTKTCKTQGLIVKLDAEGNELWKKTYGDTAQRIAFHDAVQLPNGNFIFAGSDFESDTTGNAYILATDEKGNTISSQLCGGNYSLANCVAAQGNNSFLIAGLTGKFDHDGDFYWMETDNTSSGVPAVKVAVPRIYPNPVRDRSVVILPESEAYQPCLMEVINTSGIIVYSRANIAAKDLVIQRSIFAPGNYLLRISCEDGKVYKGRFTIE